MLQHLISYQLSRLEGQVDYPILFLFHPLFSWSVQCKIFQLPRFLLPPFPMQPFWRSSSCVHRGSNCSVLYLFYPNIWQVWPDMTLILKHWKIIALIGVVLFVMTSPCPTFTLKCNTWGVFIFLQFAQFSNQLTKTWSLGATECGVWIGNCNVKVWKSTEHKLHNIWHSVKFCINSGKRAHPREGTSVFTQTLMAHCGSSVTNATHLSTSNVPLRNLKIVLGVRDLFAHFFVADNI